MKTASRRTGLVCGCALALCANAVWSAAPEIPVGGRTDYPLVSVSAGFDVTDGKYGGNSNTRIVEIPFRLRYETASHVFSVTQPYVEIHSERAAVITDGAVVVGETRTRQRVSGMGDVVSAYTYKSDPSASGWYADYTARMKIATADADKGLGTGKNDYSFQVYLARDFGRFTPSVEAGYRFRGKPAGLELRDSAYGAIGALYRLEGQSRIEAYYDYREAATANAAPQRELSVYYAYRPARRVRFDVYVVKGYSENSPDRGIGGRFALYF